jgi:phosphoglycerol transferase MdoB-like AlkP superfamily enzyme
LTNVLAIKSVQAIRRFILNAWYVAAPLLIILILFGALIFSVVAQNIIERVYGRETAEAVFDFCVNAMM